MIENELEILINHIQQEVDYLKGKMDACIADWDFQGAETFKKPLVYTKSKLEIVKCLKDPNYRKKSRLQSTISYLEKNKKTNRFENSIFTEVMRQRMEEHFIKSTNERIEKSKIELKTLESIPLEAYSDDDNILGLLEQLLNGKLSSFELELKEGKIYLEITSSNDNPKLKISCKNDKILDHYIVKPAKVILNKLGFENISNVQKVMDVKGKSKFEILEVIAIVAFEVFELSGERKVRIVNNEKLIINN